MHVRLGVVMADYRALVKVEVGPQIPAKIDACRVCKQEGVTLLNKTVYGQQFRYLDVEHPLRRQACRINTTLRSDRQLREGVVLPNIPHNATAYALKTKAERKKLAYEDGQSIALASRHEGYARVVTARTGFFRLPYFDPCDVMVYDAMHSIGGTCEQVFDIVRDNSRYSQQWATIEATQNHRFVDPSHMGLPVADDVKDLIDGRLKTLRQRSPLALRRHLVTTPMTNPRALKTHSWFLMCGPIGEVCIAR